MFVMCLYPYVCKFRDFLLKYIEIQKEKFSKNRQIKSEPVFPRAVGEEPGQQRDRADKFPHLKVYLKIHATAGPKGILEIRPQIQPCKKRKSKVFAACV